MEIPRKHQDTYGRSLKKIDHSFKVKNNKITNRFSENHIIFCEGEWSEGYTDTFSENCTLFLGEGVMAILTHPPTKVQ